jgi:hypothetical protein
MFIKYQINVIDLPYHLVLHMNVDKVNPTKQSKYIQFVPNMKNY